MENGNGRSASVQQLQTILDEWSSAFLRSDYDPVPDLDRIAELLEQEMGRFLTTDPDPYDEHYLVKTDKSDLRIMHGVIYRVNDFLNRLVNDYILNGSQRLAIATCRVLINLTSAISINLGLADNNLVVDRLYQWATSEEKSDLVYLSTFLLGVTMEIPEHVTIHKERNFNLIKICLKRLHELSKVMVQANGPRCYSAGFNVDECSNSSWKGDPEQSNVGQYKLDNLTVELKQRLCLKFLIPMAEYQDMLPHMVEGNALELVFTYLDSNVTSDVRLIFEGLRFLTSLLCHKRISAQFIQSNGIQCMLTVPRPSMASTAVAVNLYYMAYFEDAMELVCRLPMVTLEKIVDYALWLLECSHESGRCYILMFFSHAFSYKVILNLFDRRDGFRRLVNVLSTQPVLSEPEAEPRLEGADEGPALPGGAPPPGRQEMNGASDRNTPSEDTIYTSRQVIKLVSTVMRKYMEVQAILRGEQLAQEHPWAYGSQSPPVTNETVFWKPIRYSTEQLHETLDVIFSLGSTAMTWPAVDSFERLGCLHLFLRVLVHAAFEWGQYAGRTETVRNMIDTLAVCVAVPRVMDLFTSSQVSAGGNTYEGVELMLLMTDNDEFLEPAAQRAALFLLSACVCRPLEGKKDVYLETNLRPPVSALDRKRKHCSSDSNNFPPSIDTYLRRMWNAVRRFNGIMILLRLLETRSPISDADAIRELACKALLGLSRDEAVNQMLVMLPLFAKGTLQYLMKEPVLPDKQAEHNRFCRYAVHLMQRVCGQPLSNLPADFVSMEKLRRAEIVASTKIHWDQKELLALIHKHLLQKGLGRTAETLQKEADLGHLVLPPPPSPPAIYAEPEPPEKEAPSTPVAPSSTTSIRISLNTTSTPTSSSVAPPSTPVLSNLPSAPSTPASALTSQHKLHLSRDRPAPPTPSISNVFLQPARTNQAQPCVHSSEQSLEKIIEGYLIQQHALCPHPVTTCPSFSLLRPHRCPEPRKKTPVSTNMVTRLMQRQLDPRMSTMDYMREHRRFIFSRFKPHYVYRDTDGEHCSACCFSPNNDNLLYVGVGQMDNPNDIKVVNLATEEMYTWSNVLNTSINHMCLSPDGRLMITCTTWTAPSICLWQMPAEISDQSHLVPKLKIEEEGYAEFSKTSSSSIVVTKETSALVVDTASGETVVTLYDAQKCNNYQRNRACFSYCDQLVLNDGVLWDLRTAKAVHKFDKLQNEFSGVFHPNRQEVLIGSAVWDLRTFGLSKNISALEGLEPRFNATGHVMYAGAFYWQDEFNNFDLDQSLRGIFRTMDSLDYGLIATIDLKRRLHCLALDRSDRYLALIESNLLETKESVCRVYQVGRNKAIDEDDDAETEDGQEGADEGGAEDSLDDDDMVGLIDLVAAAADEDGDGDDGDGDDDDDDDDLSDMFAEFGDSDSSSHDSGNESSTEEEDDEGYEESSEGEE